MARPAITGKRLCKLLRCLHVPHVIVSPEMCHEKSFKSTYLEYVGACLTCAAAARSMHSRTDSPQRRSETHADG